MAKLALGVLMLGVIVNYGAPPVDAAGYDGPQATADMRKAGPGPQADMRKAGGTQVEYAVSQDVPTGQSIIAVF